MQYLKQRTLSFSEGEKAVTLLIDEVYSCQLCRILKRNFCWIDRIWCMCKNSFEIYNGVSLQKLRGCCLFVTSRKTRYWLVSLHYWFIKVMKYLNEIFLVVVVSVDNHICNR